MLEIDVCLERNNCGSHPCYAHFLECGKGVLEIVYNLRVCLILFFQSAFILKKQKLSKKVQSKAAFSKQSSFFIVQKSQQVGPCFCCVRGE
jgi:hypothetical protein